MECWHITLMDKAIHRTGWSLSTVHETVKNKTLCWFKTATSCFTNRVETSYTERNFWFGMETAMICSWGFQRGSRLCQRKKKPTRLNKVRLYSKVTKEFPNFACDGALHYFVIVGIQNIMKELVLRCVRFNMALRFFSSDSMLLNLLQVFLAVSRAKGAVKFLPTSITETGTLNTHAVWIKETESFHVRCVTGPLTSGIASVFTCYMCTRNTALTNVQFAANGSLSHLASTNTWEYTAERDHTNVLTASRPSQLLLFYAHTSVNTAERSPSSVGIVGARSPRMRRMIVMFVVRTLKRSHACVNTVERLLLSPMNWSFTSTCTLEPSLTLVRNAAEHFQALRHVIDTVLILTA